METISPIFDVHYRENQLNGVMSKIVDAIAETNLNFPCPILERISLDCSSDKGVVFLNIDLNGVEGHLNSAILGNLDDCLSDIFSEFGSDVSYGGLDFYLNDKSIFISVYIPDFELC